LEVAGGSTFGELGSSTETIREIEGTHFTIGGVGHKFTYTLVEAAGNDRT
jgi:hypothetical protein